MPDTTPILALPFPEVADSPNGAAQIQALAEAVEALLVPAWTNMTLNTGAGWTASGSTPQRRKIGDIVYLRGRVTSPGGGGSSQPFTLPAGSRPGQDVEFFGRVGSSGTEGSINIAAATGICTINGTPSAGGVVLDAISFSTTA